MQARTLPTSDAPSRHAWLRSIACAKKVVSEESRKSLGLMLGTTAAYGGLTLVEYAAIFEGNYVTGGGPALFTHLRYHGVMDVIEEKRDSIVRVAAVEGGTRPSGSRWRRGREVDGMERAHRGRRRRSAADPRLARLTASERSST